MLADIGLGRSEIECACRRRPSAEVHDLSRGRRATDRASDAVPYHQAA
jgi:hypothetical protein